MDGKGERRGTSSFLTRAFATEVFPEADGPAMPITWRVNHGGLYSGLSFIITPTTTTTTATGSEIHHQIG